MKTIYKYELHACSMHRITMPTDSKVLHAGLQDGIIYIWVEVDDARETEIRSFGIFGTGQKLPDGSLEFIGTVLAPPFVWHIYEL